MEAFDEVKSKPEKYGKKFETMMPKKTWSLWASKSIEELRELACELGDHNADWVEQALEWAQRIFNGELWEAVCNNEDTANWQRLVIWKNGYYWRVGGASTTKYIDINIIIPASNVDCHKYRAYESINYTVPLVVRYEN